MFQMACVSMIWQRSYFTRNRGEATAAFQVFGADMMICITCAMPVGDAHDRRLLQGSHILILFINIYIYLQIYLL